jgi:hypothetical protein
MRDGGRVLRRNILRDQSGARQVIGRESAWGNGQRRLEERLEKVLERAHVGCRGGKLLLERGSREADIRLAASALTGSVFVVPGRSVMVVFSVLDGRLVEGGLRQGDVRAPQPSDRRDGLGEDHDQR